MLRSVLDGKSPRKNNTRREVNKIKQFADYLSYFQELSTKLTAERHQHLAMKTINLKITGKLIINFCNLTSTFIMTSFNYF